MDLSKSVGIDNLGGRFLKDEARELPLSVTQPINLSITSYVFPNQCKVAKFKPILKNIHIHSGLLRSKQYSLQI